MRVHGVLADRSGCGHYRMILPFTELARQHPDSHYALTEDVPADVAGIDVLVAQRTCLPGASATFQRHAREGLVKTVLELDDDLFALDPSNRAAHRFFDPELLANLRRNIEVADLVTVSTGTLADVVSAFTSAPVVVLPNQVPAWLLEHERVRTERLTIGWRGGPSHSRDFGELAAPLRRSLQHPDHRGRVEFHSMGANYTDRVASRHALTRHTGWMPGVADFLRAVDFAVAVIPLRPSRFNRCKSDLALLEMSALGVPSIASDCAGGPYDRARFVDGAPCRLAVMSEGDWQYHLRDLLHDDAARELLGKQAREWAATRTIEGNAHQWVAAYAAG
jgi:hypothetical protein